MSRITIKPISLIAAALLLLGACSAAKVATDVPVVQGAVSTVASNIEGACTVANSAASAAAPFAAVPEVGVILSFEQSGCATADAVAGLVVKAVDDPTTVQWIENLATELNTAVAAVKKL